MECQIRERWCKDLVKSFKDRVCGGKKRGATGGTYHCVVFPAMSDTNIALSAILPSSVLTAACKSAFRSDHYWIPSEDRADKLEIQDKGYVMLKCDDGHDGDARTRKHLVALLGLDGKHDNVRVLCQFGQQSLSAMDDTQSECR
jgi:hypothetical protein